MLGWMRLQFSESLPRLESGGKICPDLTESVVEEAALSWFRELGYAVEHGAASRAG